jgi:branched-chain amino acid transport system substrate-binding protein
MKKHLRSLLTLTLALALAIACGKPSDPPAASAAKPADPPADPATKEAPAAKAEAPAKPKAKPATAGATAGVTKDTIKVGQWGPQTGPAALWGSVARGTRAYFEMINAAGGIHGRKLELLIRDDAYQPPRTKAAVMELVEKEGVFAFVGGLGTGTGMAVKDYLAQKKIPWIGPASGSSNWARTPTRYLFSVYPTYTTEAKAMVRHLVGVEKREKIAILYQNDDYGTEALEAARAELKAAGKELVAEVSVEMTDQDLSSHVLKLKAAGPDAVLLWLLPKQAAITLGTAAKLGFKPIWAASSSLSDAPLMHKITRGLWDGVLFTSIMELPDSEHPMVKQYKQAFETHGKEHNPKETWGIFFMAGFTFAEPFVEALRRVGPELDREKLVAALESLKGWDKGIGHKITFGPKERQGQKAAFIARCEGGKAVKVGDWIAVE